MDFLITGATGFVGHRLVPRLLDGGNEVSYLARKRGKTLDTRAAFHPWTSPEPPPLDSVPTAEVVIHLAGEPVAQRWNSEVKRCIYDSRVNGTRQLVSAIEKLKHKPRVLISASATGYYGQRGDEILTETSPPGHDFLADLCVEWEREALKAREFGTRVVLIRIAPVIGRGGGMLAKTLPAFRLGLGGNIGSGRQWMPWVHVDDLMSLILYAAVHEPMNGPYNASAPTPVTNAEFTRELSAVVHRPAIFSVPLLALKLGLGEAAHYMAQSQRIIPEKTLESGFQFRYPDLTSALNEAAK